MTTKKDDRKWCWTPADVYDDRIFGQFGSKAEAIMNAGRYYADVGPAGRHYADIGPVEIEVGRVETPEPADYVMYGFDMDYLLEQMEETATDDGWWSGEDPLFEDKKGAEEALKEHLMAWARNHLVASGIYTMKDSEKVVIDEENTADAFCACDKPELVTVRAGNWVRDGCSTCDLWLGTPTREDKLFDAKREDPERVKTPAGVYDE